ncbi:DUF3857 domain-containing protein [Filimonas lacunae]|nr:DUF3857 domain-containing protein [Filimonas lacunae]BAV06210.1 transglutaminase-like enzymes, putative cysteine proteases [Filimonas lacunae]
MVTLQKAGAQTVEELAVAYPHAYAVMLNYTKDITLFMENGEPKAESKVAVDILILDDKANGMYNRYTIYHGSFTPLGKVDAYTDVPVKRGYDRIKVPEIKTDNSRSRSVFYDDVKVSSFDFPSLKKGAIAHVQYTQYDNDVHLLSPLYFVSYMPVINQKVTVTYPKQMVLNYKLRNDSLQQVQVVTGKKGSSLTYTFTANNLKEMDRPPDAPSPSYDEPHVLLYVSSYLDKDDKRVGFLDNLDELYQWNYAFLRKVPAVNHEKMQLVADSLTHGLHSDTDKARAIYSFVQHNIKYVAFENGLEGFIPRPADLVYDRKFGDCKDMASLLTDLLTRAGVKAWVTWIGTRDIPYDYTDVALPLTDNHMICTALVNGEYVFLDGTDPGCIYGFPTAFIQGKQALVAIGEKEHKVLRIPEMDATKNRMVDTTLISVTDKGIKGSTRLRCYGYMGTAAYNNFSANKNPEDNKEDVKRYTSKGNNRFILDTFQINYISDAEKIMCIQTQFSLPGYYNKLGDEIYINLNLDKLLTSDHIIDTAHHKTASLRRFKYILNQYTKMELPEGYSIESIPDNFKYNSEELSFEITYTKESKAIVVRQQLQSNSLMLPKSRFVDWNNAVRKIISQYKEQVILQKKS